MNTQTGQLMYTIIHDKKILPIYTKHVTIAINKTLMCHFSTKLDYIENPPTNHFTSLTFSLSLSLSLFPLLTSSSSVSHSAVILLLAH